MSINSIILRVSKKTCIRKSTTRYLSYDYYNETGELRLPKHAKVVICGGGVMGASVAYHLAELGLGPQTIVMEKGRYCILNLSERIF